MKNTHVLGREYRLRILEILARAEVPLDVENVRTIAGIRNWESTKSILLELVVEGKISGARTSKGWVFSMQPLRC